MTPVRTLERVVHAPPFGLAFRDALRTALRRPDRLTPRDVRLEVTERFQDGTAEPLAEPLELVRQVVARSGLTQIEGAVLDPARAVPRRLADADYRVRVSHSAFEAASLVLHLPIRPPRTEAPDAPPPGGASDYAELLAARRREVVLRPGAGYALPQADAVAGRSQLVVAGRFAEPFDGTVRLARPETPEPGGLADPGGPEPASGFVLWTRLPADEALPDGEIDLVLKPRSGASRTVTYAIDLAVADPGERATLVRPRRPRGRAKPPSLTLLML